MGGDAKATGHPANTSALISLVEFSRAAPPAEEFAEVPPDRKVVFTSPAKVDVRALKPLKPWSDPNP